MRAFILSACAVVAAGAASADPGALVVHRPSVLIGSDRAAGVVTITDLFDDMTPGGALNQLRPAGCPTWVGPSGLQLPMLPAGGVTQSDGSVGVALEGMHPDAGFFSARGNLPVRLTPSAGAPAWSECDLFITNIDGQCSFTPGDSVSGFVVTRVLFGGNCVGAQCADEGFPNGDIVDFHSLVTHPNVPGAGYWQGSGVQAPVNAWFRLAVEVASDATLRTWADLLDGQGWRLLAESDQLLASAFDTILVNGNSSQASPSSSVRLYADRLVVSGFSAVPPCPGDATGNGTTDFADLNTILDEYGQQGAGLMGDINDDGAVDFNDLNGVLGAYGVVCGCV